MTTHQAVVPRNRRPKGQHPRTRDPDGRKTPYHEATAGVPGGPPGRDSDTGGAEPEGKAAVPDRVACRSQDLRGAGASGPRPVARE